MFGSTFYFKTIRKYVVLVGTLMNDIHIKRTDSSNNTVALLKVPVTYAPKDKMLARVTQDPNIDRPTATAPLPLISFEMGQMKYDGTRKLPTINRSVVRDSTNTSKFLYQYNPVPYNIDFKVYIYAKNAEDGTKIIEQILPYFTPDWTTTVNLIPEMNIVMDIPIILNDIRYEDNYAQGDFTKRRAIIWTLDLVLKGYFYGPVKKSGIIKFVDTNFYTPSVTDGELRTAVGNSEIISKVTIQPAIYAANNAPLNYYGTANSTLAAESIAYTEIDINDDFGYLTQIYDEEQLI